MIRILIATVLVAGFAGTASAQQAPMIQGDYSANVENSYNHVDTMRGQSSQGAMIDYTGTASVRDTSAWNEKDDHSFDIYTGK